MVSATCPLLWSVLAAPSDSTLWGLSVEVVFDRTFDEKRQPFPWAT